MTLVLYLKMATCSHFYSLWSTRIFFFLPLTTMLASGTRTKSIGQYLINQKLMMTLRFTLPVKSTDIRFKAPFNIGEAQLSQRCMANTNGQFLLPTKIVVY